MYFKKLVSVHILLVRLQHDVKTESHTIYCNKVDAFLHSQWNVCLIQRLNRQAVAHLLTITKWQLAFHILSESTHTHPFNSPFSRTTQVSRYQKGRTNLDFTEARDSEWQWHQLGQMQVCTLLQTDNHASTPPLRFLKARCPSCCPTNSVKALKKAITQKLWTQYFSWWQKALFLFYTFSLKWLPYP